jgi:ubiquinone/menaquinone biosynthesis C-methylase UbiE
VVWLVAWCALGGPVGCGAAQPKGHGGHDATSRHPFDNAAYWSSVFDDPKRDGWQRPDAVVAALALQPGMWVADLGAGTGYFSRRLAQAVAPGVLFAVETEPNLVTHLRARAEREHTDNVVPVLASASNPRLPPGALDLVLIVDTYHHIDDRLTYFRRLQGMLKPTGRVAIIDWHKHPLPEGPPPEHKLAREHVLAEMTQSGWRLLEAPEILSNQYFLIFGASARTDAP